MTERLQVLLVEDNPADVELIREMLPERGNVSVRLESVPRLSRAVSRLKRGNIDLALLDLGLPDSQGLQTFHKLRDAAPEIPIIVLTGNGDQDTAVAAVREGAQDYFIKGEVTSSLLARAAQYAVERRRIQEALRRSEENFRRSLDESPLGIRIVTAEGESLYANRAMLDIYGFGSIEELKATPVKT
ncbi:MAG: response regulator, partial [Candidatus Aminicenantales bacterium]